MLACAHSVCNAPGFDGSGRRQCQSFFPRAQSDPGTPRLDGIWKQQRLSISSRTPVAPIPAYTPRRHRHHSSLHPISEIEPPNILSIASPSIPVTSLHTEPWRSVGVQCPSAAVYSEQLESACRRRNCAMQIIMWPWDCLEATLSRSCNISDETMRLLNFVYRLIVIVGAMFGLFGSLYKFFNPAGGGT